jgi:CDP-glucose 4,6-dehydratase
LEPLSGYLLLAAKMLQEPTAYCEGWNFGPRMESVRTVWEVAKSLTPNPSPTGEGSEALHEANLLLLDISKAKFRLGWEPRTDIDTCCQLTADWYRRYRTEDVYQLCVEQIKTFLGD